MSVIVEASRFLIVSLFLISGLAKLRDPKFGDAIIAYRLTSAGNSRLIARYLPTVEIVLAIFLALGIGSPVPASIIALLLACFAVAVTLNLLRGRSIDCGCYGASSPRSITWRHAVNNVALGFLALFVGWSQIGVVTSLSHLGPALPRPEDRLALFISCLLLVCARVLLSEYIRLVGSIRSRRKWVHEVVQTQAGLGR